MIPTSVAHASSTGIKPSATAKVVSISCRTSSTTDTGVGVDVQVGDVNGDKLPDIVVGNKAGVFILTQERKDTTADLTPKKLYGPALGTAGRIRQRPVARRGVEVDANSPAASKQSSSPRSRTSCSRSPSPSTNAAASGSSKAISYPQPREVGKGTGPHRDPRRPGRRRHLRDEEDLLRRPESRQRHRARLRRRVGGGGTVFDVHPTGWRQATAGDENRRWQMGPSKTHLPSPIFHLRRPARSIGHLPRVPGPS